MLWNDINMWIFPQSKRLNVADGVTGAEDGTDPPGKWLNETRGNVNFDKLFRLGSSVRNVGGGWKVSVVFDSDGTGNGDNDDVANSVILMPFCGEEIARSGDRLNDRFKCPWDDRLCTFVWISVM